MSEFLSDVAEEVASNSENLNTLTDLVSNLFSTVSRNGVNIKSLHDVVLNLKSYTLQTSELLTDMVRTLISMVAENADKLAYLEMYVDSIAEKIDFLSLLIYVSLGIGAFNTVALVVLITFLIIKRKNNDR